MIKGNAINLVVLIGLFMFPVGLFGQEVTSFYNNIKSKINDRKLKITGGLTASSGINLSTGIPTRSDPFSYRLMGNVNLGFMGVTIPLNLNFTDSKIAYNYRLPSYKLYGMSPSYKWATLHVGDRGMNFSEYTFAGQNFRGVGTELTPGKITFAAFYGTLKRAVPEELSGLQSLQPSFKRIGWGAKIGYKGERHSLELMLFKATDNAESIPSLIQNPEILPQENVVIGLVSNHQLNKKISFNLDYAISGITKNLIPEEEKLNATILESFGGLLNTNSGTEYKNAIKTSLDFKVNNATSIQLNHEWIDAGYKTLGSLFFNDDVENITTAVKTVMLNKRVTLATNIGVQRNNLSGTKANTDIRLIGSVNASVKPNELLGISMSYSNFRNSSARVISIPIQSGANSSIDGDLYSSIVQVSQNASFQTTYILGSENKSTLTGLLSYQKSNLIENEQLIENQVNTFYIGSLSYAYLFKTIDLTTTSTITSNYGVLPNVEVFNLSPTLAISKSFLKKKMITSSSISFVNNFSNRIPTDRIFSFQSSIKYSFSKKQSIGLDLRYLKRYKLHSTLSEPSQAGFSEFIVNLQYSYKF